MSVFLSLSRLIWLLFIFILNFSFYFSLTSKTIIIEWELLSFNTSLISIPLILDKWGIIFSSLVLFISANVIQFAHIYIDNESHPKRFALILSLFILSINLLIFIPHIIILLIGWDGLGIVSFVLVIHYQSTKAIGAGIITALSNRIGDVIILISIALIINAASWTPSSLFYPTSQLTAIFIIIAAITKSAQLPFSRWLPAAIAAPTPVSALVHSSTLVTAGVFLLFRFYPSLSLSPIFHPTLLIIAMLTITIAGINAVAETDIKKIVALSTLRQLGVIIARLAIACPLLTLFHLITHALFKALLFICAGSLIYFFNHAQDMRQFGIIITKIPFTSSCLLLANLALAGIPFLAGFYSKDAILEFALFSPFNMVSTSLFIMATFFTVIYSTRFIIYTTLSPFINPPHLNQNDENKHLNTPIFILTLGAIFRGRLLNWILLSPLPEPFIPQSLKISIPILIFLTTILAAPKFSTSLFSHLQSTNLFKFNQINAHIWFLTPLSSQNILKISIHLPLSALIYIDQGWGETTSSQGLNQLSSKFSSSNSSWQTSSLFAILTSTFLFIIILIFLY